MAKSILFVTSELADFVQSGGLGAVSAALPRTLRRDCDIRVLIPGYRQVLARCGPIEIVGHLGALASLPACSVGLATAPDGLKIYVLICNALFDRPGSPYGDEGNVDWPDNDLRFARLSLAAALLAAGAADPAWSANLIHANDWPTALVPAYVKWLGLDISSLLTIHNLAYQGLFSRDTLPRIGAPDEAFGIDGMEFYGKASFLKAGIAYATHVTTVSETYAKEITRPEFGCGLDGLLRLRAAEQRLTGILNGIDESWDPRVSPHLATPFEAGDWKGKAANRDAARGDFNLAVSRGPLFSVVSRLVHQKGIDLVAAAGESIVASGGQIAVLGRGELVLEHAMRALGARYPGQVSVNLDFGDRQGRRLLAGSDFLLMPSRFEPCGLSQMYAQRFGTLPIAHRTGGLAETIEDGKSGFLFSDLSTGGLMQAVKRAVDTYAAKRSLNAMRRRAMGKSYDWRRSASLYEALYGRVIGTRLVRAKAAVDAAPAAFATAGLRA